jgi:hypothetical protein
MQKELAAVSVWAYQLPAQGLCFEAEVWLSWTERISGNAGQRLR